MSLDGLDLPLSQLEQQVVAWAAEALDLRFGASPLPPSGSGPHVLQDSLVVLRQRLDRCEGLMAAVIQARGRSRRASTEGKNLAEDAWGHAIHGMPKREYEGPRERYAEASLLSFEQQRESRQAARLLDVVQESYDVVKLSMDGLSSLRYDHVAALRAFSFESSLER